MNQFDQIDKFKKTFFQECDERIADLEAQINASRQTGDVAEPLNAIFRALHTIKGGAGMFGFSRIANFAHTFENALERFRAGELVIADAILTAFLESADVLADLIQAARSGEELPADYEAECAEQLGLLAGPQEPAVTATRAATAAQASPEPERAPVLQRFQISFRPKPRLLSTGNEPLLIFRHLKELGTLTVTADLSQLPDFADLDPAQLYLSWTLELETSAGRTAIEEAFEFVESDCDLAINALATAPVSSATAVARKPGSGPAVALANPDVALPPKPAALGQSRRIASIRVELDRIDKLVNMVGEIAVLQAMITQQADQALTTSHPLLAQEISNLFQLTQALQDSVMAIRAVPVSTIFARMPRLVRELANATGKRVTLETVGEETEIDKTVIEELGDPLIHMIRNAVDHGIEPPEERLAAGKPANGKISLQASQRGGQIVIEVSDDGRGIDHEKVRQRAVDQNLISASAVLTDDEISNLVFQPGFSTAAAITELSGRGVGLDVVKRNIQKLGGRVTIRSERGAGSKMVIALPLTLAVLPGMIVRSGTSPYVIPLSHIVECKQAARGQVKSLPELGEVFKFRDSYVPLVRLNRVFNANTSNNTETPLIVVVDDENDKRLAIAVDEIIGQQQVVIKSLRDNLDPIPGFAGATILGDGKVALILVLAELLELHRHNRAHVSRAATLIRQVA